MSGAYRLQIKIGPSEFSAEGPEDTVKEAYKDFLAAISKEPRTVLAVGSSAGSTRVIGAGEVVASGLAPTVIIGSPPLEIAALERAFKREGDIISLRHLPPTVNKIADAAIALMYGYMKLGNMEDVPVTKLNEGLRRSGLNLSRLDRELGVNSSLYRKGGQRSGGRFSLNNQGLKQAEDWLREWANS